MSFNSKLTIVVNEVEENQVSITEIYSLLDDVNTEIDTKQDVFNVLSTITINEVKANSSTINGNIACSTLTLNGSDVETSLTILSSADRLPGGCCPQIKVGLLLIRTISHYDSAECRVGFI